MTTSWALPRDARRPLLLVAVALAACTQPPPPSGTPGGFDFAVMGDTPYTPEAERLYPILAEEISNAPVAFVVHIGDIKGGSAACTDSVVAGRVQQMDDVRHPLVYVPGDNDWTDCHRRPPGAYQPLERLSFLRAQAYPQPGRTRGTPGMTVESQALLGKPEFPEHQRWSHQGVIFATVHVVGSLNGLVPFAGRAEADDEEVERRIQATVSWLRDTFAQARERQALAVVVAAQADPWAIPPDFQGHTGFEEFLATLREEAEAFRRPVLFVHGDTHTLRVDRPFWTEDAPSVPNLIRLETYGSPDVGWIQVHVDPASHGVFGFTPRQVVPTS